MTGKAMAGLGAALLGVLLAVRIADGSYTALVQAWYEPVLVGTAVVLLGLAAVVSVQAAREKGTLRARLTPGALAMIGLAALPVAMGLAYQPQPLGTKSLETLQDGGRSSLQFSSTAAGADAAQRNVYQWAYEFANTEPALILGDPVDVTGFVYHAEGEPAGVFSVARFVVACCVADARGFTLPVQWAEAESLPNDQWVRVRGRVATDAEGQLVILAETVETVEIPANPYIYP
jgi:putative membrane protein